MRGLLPFAAAMLAVTPLPALADDHGKDGEAERLRVIAAVENFMGSFNAKDADGMTAMAVSGATVSMVQEREGADRARSVPLETLITSIASSPADLQEPVWNLDVMQEGPVATVVANFEFLIDGVRSHCGTNVFNLLRIDGEWKIAGIAYSHIEEGCFAAPKE